MVNAGDLRFKLMGLLFAVIMLITGLTLGDTVVDTVQAVNTTDWAFTGYQAVENIIDLFPLLYYTGIMVAFVASIYLIARSGD